MPYEPDELHRDKIPKAKYRVTNWFEYDRGLVQRGDVRFWIDEAVIADRIAPWRKGPGGQRGADHPERAALFDKVLLSLAPAASGQIAFTDWPIKTILNNFASGLDQSR